MLENIKYGLWSAKGSAVVLLWTLCAMPCLARTNTQAEILPNAKKRAPACERIGLEQGLWHMSQVFLHHSPSTENVVFSPYSWAQALAALQFASEGRTQQQIASVLCVPADPDLLAHRWAMEQTQRLTRASRWPKQVGFFPAMSLWSAPSTKVTDKLQAYVNLAFGETWHVPEQHHAQDTIRHEINRWTSEKTHGHIQKILPDTWAVPDMSVFLVNTLFFQAPWSRMFDANKTSLQPFWNADQSITEVSTMQQVVLAGYAREQEHQIVELLYQKGQFSLTLIWSDVADVLHLPRSVWQRVQAPLPMQRIALKIPKYRIQSRLRLKHWLQHMGLTDAFEPRHAGFTQMLREHQPVFVDEILHQAHFVVEEQGSHASAAVVSGLRTTAWTSQVKQVQLNRPFVFLLRDKKTGFVLFAGRVAHLSAETQKTKDDTPGEIFAAQDTQDEF